MMYADQRPSDVARQQVRVRTRNETALAELAADPEELRILCECGGAACAVELTVNTDVYRAVRARPGRFIVTRHHRYELDRVLRPLLGGLTIVESTYVGDVDSAVA
jgi:hypothetical protein